MSGLQSRVAAARSRLVNTITVRKQNHLARTLLTFQQSSLPAHQRPQFQSDVMDDSQETRLPESQADQLYFEDGVGNDDAHGDNSDDDGIIYDSVVKLSSPPLVALRESNGVVHHTHLIRILDHSLK